MKIQERTEKAKSAIIPYHDIIRLRKNETIPNIYDVEMKHFEHLQKYDSMECHIVLYPYSRKICSQNIKFFPFEEYVKDILSCQKSAYIPIRSQFNEIFGLLMGLVLIIIFALFKPADLFSLEAIVSVLGVYFVGKELWDDIERLLINISKTWSLRYQENYYAYQLGKHTTLTHYSRFAKKNRYGKVPLLPEKMDFIEQSNSQTTRMCFKVRDLQSLQDSTGHMFSIHIDPDVVQEFEQEGFMFGVKLSFNKHFLGFVYHFELFQSLHKGSKGCLDEKGEWIEGGIFYRKTLTLGRLKLFIKSGLLHQETIIE
jgi:hypothetical protein